MIMKVISNITLRVGKGKDRSYAEPGAEVDLTDAEAEVLLNRGQVRAVTATKAVATQPSLEDIADAIDQLDEQKDFKDGIPNLKAIERVLKSPVTVAQRDEVWAKIQADKKAAAK
jgi:hypothetical protein